MAGSIFLGGHWLGCVANPGGSSPQGFAAEHDRLREQKRKELTHKPEQEVRVLFLENGKKQ